MEKEQVVLSENSRSVAHRRLPPIPEGADDGQHGTILLMYQYKEPCWTKSEHKQALKRIIEIAEHHKIKGRGRVAPEGVNFTLSGSPENIHNFCYALREYNPMFEETDFKLTYFVPTSKLFKSLSIRKTNELVAYGLAGDAKAPSLQTFAGVHLEAEDYHKAMSEKDTVIVDVRNAYESAIGSFQPPQGGAELIDPKMRNSIEFPKWLNDPKTQQQLNGKKVLMYCTGGIRCERATALLNQMSTVNPNLKPKGVYELRGGIERYVKTFPEGGYWKGKNYLFDRRMEQIPGNKSTAQIDQEISSKCCLCRQPCTSYRGKFKCCQSLCGVPVIVCQSCESLGLQHPEKLNCELCKQRYRTPDTLPDLVELKRKAESLVKMDSSAESTAKRPKTSAEEKATTHHHKKRLFLSRLPLTVTVTKLQKAIPGTQLVHWLTDPKTGSFYGSCIVEMVSEDAAAQAVAGGTLKIDKKKVKIAHAIVKDDEIWPPKDYQFKEFPPIG